MEYHNCRCCDCVYEEHPKDKISRRTERYDHYLGICSPECRAKLTDDGYQKLSIHTFLYGDSRKKNKVKIDKSYLK